MNTRMRALAVATMLSVAGCSFAVQHPAATVAIVGGTIGAATCEIGTDFGNHAACAGVSLGAAALLGGVVLLATALGGEGDTVLRAPPPEESRRPVPPSIDDLPPPAPEPAVPAPAPEPAPDPSPAP